MYLHISTVIVISRANDRYEYITEISKRKRARENGDISERVDIVGKKHET